MGRPRIKQNPGRKRYSVFLSHSSKDKWLARVIDKKIRSAGAEVWLDEISIQSGQNIHDRILLGMRKANEVIVLVSNESIKSQWVAVEIGMAKALKRHITPLLNSVDADAMAPLRDIKCCELNLFDKWLTELKERIKRHGA